LYSTLRQNPGRREEQEEGRRSKGQKEKEVENTRVEGRILRKQGE
jgi:hypothetical protein